MYLNMDKRAGEVEDISCITDDEVMIAAVV